MVDTGTFLLELLELWRGTQHRPGTGKLHCPLPRDRVRGGLGGPFGFILDIQMFKSEVNLYVMELNGKKSYIILYVCLLVGIYRPICITA